MDQPGSIEVSVPHLRRIASGLRFPEGPIACDDGSVLLVEIEGGMLVRISSSGDRQVIADLGGGPNGAAIGPDGACYVCNNGGLAFVDHPQLGLIPVAEAADYSGGRIERVDLASGAVTRLYDNVDGRPLRGPNDIVFDRQGGFWFTDHGKTRARDADLGGVYYAAADGSSVREVIFPMTTPNGVGLSGDETRLYVAEALPGRLWEFEITAPGEIASRPFPSFHGGRLLHGSTRFQRFDSLAVDATGAVCVATCIDGAMTVVSTDRSSRRIPLPDVFPTNICFGGPDLHTAFITLGGRGELVAMDWPEGGLLLNFQGPISQRN